MKLYRRTFALFTAIVSLLLVTLPLPNTYADVSIHSFTIHGDGNPYLIGGTEIFYTYSDDRAISTNISNVKVDYSTDNGLNWIAVLDLQDKDSSGYFRLPIDPTVTTALFRIRAKYSPFIGGDSYPQARAGPFPVMQPGEVSDLTATANDDGSVTLNWNDNSNMESNYLIKRVGPEGTKYFNVQNSAVFGPMSTVDKTTSKTKNSFYGYSVTPVIDKYKLPDDVLPGIDTVFVVNKASLGGKVFDLDIIDSVVRDSVISQIDNNKPKSIITGATDLKPVDGVKFPDLKGKVVTENPQDGASGNAATAEALLDEVVKGASDWAKTDVKVAIVQSLTTSAVLGRYQDPITREHFAGIAVKLYEALSGYKASAVSPNPFQDTSRPDVLKANKLGIVTGVSDNLFSPYTAITRQEICVMLIRAIRAAKPAATLQTNQVSSFSDENLITSWALEAVNIAVNHKIMNGIGEGKIDPLGNTTREQGIVLVKRTFDAFK